MSYDHANSTVECSQPVSGLHHKQRWPLTSLVWCTAAVHFLRQQNCSAGYFLYGRVLLHVKEKY